MLRGLGITVPDYYLINKNKTCNPIGKSRELIIESNWTDFNGIE